MVCGVSYIAVMATYCDDLMEAFRQGIIGPIRSAFVCFRPWGFKLKPPTTDSATATATATATDSAPTDPHIPAHIPVSVWHGDRDYFIPFAAGEWMARTAIPNASWHPVAGAGHFFAFENSLMTSTATNKASAAAAKEKEALRKAGKPVPGDKTGGGPGQQQPQIAPINQHLKAFLTEMRDLHKQTSALPAAAGGVATGGRPNKR